MTNPNPQTVYYVRSDRDPRRFYFVTTDAYGALVCECPSATFYRKPCKHCRRIVAGQVKPATVKRPARDPVRIQMSDAGRELAASLEL